MKNVLIDETGNRYGRLTVVSRAENTKHGLARWNCVCDCGNTTVVIGNHLRNGNTVSCGCRVKEGLHRTHGRSKTRLYRIWQDMKNRCGNKNVPMYYWYGAKGIRICDEWVKDFSVFCDWAMNNGYKDGLTIERIDVNGDYTPDNCKWISRAEQSLNRSDNVFLEYEGERLTVSEWAKKIGVSPYTLYHRVKKGWSAKEVLTVPTMPKNQFYMKKVRENEAGKA